jgi:hypothetical protein
MSDPNVDGSIILKLISRYVAWERGVHSAGSRQILVAGVAKHRTEILIS